MSERPPPGVPEDAALDRAEALTPGAIERVLADFRSWLEQTARAAADQAALAPPVSDEDIEPIDLHTLLGQLTALRHEVHLQTRATRAQQEQNTDTLRQFSEALETLREARETTTPEPSLDGDEALRPLLKTLIDLYDALSLAVREVQRMQGTRAMRKDPEYEPGTGKLIRQALLQVSEWEAKCRNAHGQAPAPGGLLTRWLGGASQAPAAEREVHAAAEKAIASLQETLSAVAKERSEEDEQTWRVLDSLITGYTMSLQRLERALRQHDLEPIPCVGRPFDPERMEVLEVVNDSGRPSGEVVDEIRRGYLWRGGVFRYAQVRVAKS